MALSEPVSRAIDEAFEAHMSTLFQKFVRQSEGGHLEVARTQFRKDLAVATQARSEMRAIASDL